MQSHIIPPTLVPGRAVTSTSTSNDSPLASTVEIMKAPDVKYALRHLLLSALEVLNPAVPDYDVIGTSPWPVRRPYTTRWALPACFV